MEDDEYMKILERRFERVFAELKDLRTEVNDIHTKLSRAGGIVAGVTLTVSAIITGFTAAINFFKGGGS